MIRSRRFATAVSAGLFTLGGSTAAQDVSDIDYEYLSLRGVGLEFGYIWPNRVEPAETYTLRLDLGYAGPGLRIAPSVTYLSSRFGASEIMELEDRIRDLVAEQNNGVRPKLNLGTIEYTDIAITVDAHVVWELPLDLLTFGGLGLSAHVIDGHGSMIAGTFC